MCYSFPLNMIVVVALIILSSVETFPRQISFGNPRKLSLLASGSYDPFLFDQELAAEMSKELFEISDCSNTQIKNELRMYGISSKSIFERKELMNLLARARVHKRLEESQTSRKAEISREEKLERILSEVKKVALLDTDQLQDELRGFGYEVTVDVTSKDDWTRNAALLRLGILPCKEVKPSIGSYRNRTTSFSEAQGTARNTSRGVDERFGFLSKVMHTKAEKAAKELIRASKTDYETDELEQQRSFDTERLLEEVFSCGSFDETRAWATSQPRAALEALLSALGVSVPRFTSRPTLAGIVADTVLVRKNLNIDRARPVSNPESGPAHTHTDVSAAPATSAARTARRDVVLPNDIDDAGELFKSITAPMLGNLSHLLEATTRTVFVGMKDVVKVAAEASKTEFAARLADSFRLFLSASSGALHRLAAWSAGPVLRPAHVLLLASAACVLARRGVFTFLGVIVGIRLLRLACAPVMSNGSQGGNLAANATSTLFA